MDEQEEDMLSQLTPEQIKALVQWVQDGGSFLGIHSATDTLHGNSDYLGLINGEFQAHPWTQDVTVTMKVLDPANPAAKPWTDPASKVFHRMKSVTRSPISSRCRRSR